jgi:hypothetical protein
MAKPDPERGPSGDNAEVDKVVAYFKDEIDTYERLFEKWMKRGRKIYKKYKDVRSPREEAQTRYNILWSNVQTRLPTLYARNPKVVVERRFRDADPVGRVASEILERSIQYTLDHVNDAWQVNRQTVLDCELPGRGCVWVRYVPHFKKLELDAARDEKRPAAARLSPDEVPADSAAPSDSPGETGQIHLPDEGSDGRVPQELEATGDQITNEADDLVDDETLEYEETKLDYVYWEDYGHSWARVDDEVRAKWRRVYMDREELEERFLKSEANPEGLTKSQIDAIPLDWTPKTLTDTKISITRKKAIVYEIWDSRRRKVYWMVKNYPRLLDERDDMLGLKDFFPTPRALAANLCNDDMIPVPNFTYYQDQANEIDELSSRISAITKALKVAGIRDASAEGLDRLLSEGVENALVPVSGWGAMSEKGGLAGSFALLPMEEIANTLESLRKQRTELIEDVYQLTGISDIVRGMSDPEETATAQQLKGQFSMVRIEDSQAEVQRYCRDEIVIIGQIVAGYSIETLKAISGVKLLTAAEKQQIQMELAAQQRMQQIQAMVQQAQQPAAGAPAGAPGAARPGAAPPALPPPPSHPMLPAPTATGPAVASGPGSSPAPGASLPQAAPHPAPPGGMAPGAPSQPMTPAPGQAPISPEKMKMLELPTWEEVEALLANPVLREFKLDMETDSTIKMDEEAEKRARIELITAVSGFIQQAVEAGMQAPEILPMLGELLMFGIRAFRTARAVEQTFDDMMEALIKMSKAPKPPNPEVAKVQAQGQVDIQVAQMKGQVDMQVANAQQAAQARQNQIEQQLEAQRDNHKIQLDAQLEGHKAQLQAATDRTIQELKNNFEAQRVQFETAAKLKIAEMEQQTKLHVASLQNQHDMEKHRMQLEHEKSMPQPDGKGGAKGGGSASGEHYAKLAANVSSIAEHLKKPRKVVRDESGRIAGLE